MELLPTSLGTRPRLAVEIRPEGVVAARAEDAQATVSAVAYGPLAEGTLVPGLKAGNVPGRAEMVDAVRKALEAVALKERQTTLVLPDGAVRVLLLDFDALPAKTGEALAVVRFRLKKLLPFEADEAIVSYQVMSSTRGMVRVLAVAVPKEVLAEYESVVREAGFEPGAVLPSTLAACAGLGETDGTALLVNAGEAAVTTAIVQGGVVLLHRTVDLAAEGLQEKREAVGAASLREIPAELPTSVGQRVGAVLGRSLELPLVDVHTSAGEWARQEPVSGYGMVDEERVEAEAEARARRLANEIVAQAERETGTVLREEVLSSSPITVQVEERRMTAAAREVSQAVSVAAAYFEDTLDMAPGTILATGTLGAEALSGLLRDAGFAEGEMRVREMIEPGMLTGGAVLTRVPRGWMAGVRGALRS